MRDMNHCIQRQADAMKQAIQNRKNHLPSLYGQMAGSAAKAAVSGGQRRLRHSSVRCGGRDPYAQDILEHARNGRSSWRMN